MRRVIVETPFAGDVMRNILYIHACIRDCFMRNEAPFASHAFYTQDGILDDKIPRERALGMEAGFAWGEVAEATVVYTDYGILAGMQEGINRALAAGRPVEYRKLYSNAAS